MSRTAKGRGKQDKRKNDAFRELGWIENFQKENQGETYNSSNRKASHSKSPNSGFV